MNKELSFSGAVFDLDGVITRTAKVHFRAWKKTFDDFLKSRSSTDGFKEFGYEEDYIPYVDGKSRYQGVKSFLESRDIELPYGRPADPPDEQTICGVGNRKNKLFRKIIAVDGIEIFDSTISFIKALREIGIKTGAVSSSRNGMYILEQTGLKVLFDTIVDGNISQELDLEGKPHPDIFLVAADNMEVRPGNSMIVEDAIAGVEAGKRGNFGLVLGISRSDNEEEMLAHGADIAVHDMEEFSLEDAKRWFLKELEKDTWNLTYFGFEPEKERLREALTTVGNGYFGTRGCFEGEGITDDLHYPGTYIMGLFNKLPTEVHGKTIYNNDLVNLPNWLLLQVRIDGGDYLHLCDLERLEYKHNLDLFNGIMSRSLRVRDDSGRITRIESRRFAGMHDMHLGAIDVVITPENYSGKIELRSSLDGTVINYGVERYRELAKDHLDPVSEDDLRTGINLTVKTKSSDITVYMTARTRLTAKGADIEAERRFEHYERFAAENFMFQAEENSTYRFEKLVSITTSKDTDIENPEKKSRSILESSASFDEHLEKHKQAWKKLWNVADFIIDGDRFSQETVRLYIFHLLATASPLSTEVDAGMTARGLHGEAYRGHFFWDELFTLPFYNLHLPEIARSFLLYRYRRLDAAREYARSEGYEGAMFPWQSADYGEEESQVLHYNPRSGEWDPDLSRNQRHINIAVAYNVWSYIYCTGDTEFLHDYGFEMLLEICRFWASIARYDGSDGRYHISGVMGPDEFHEKYPGTEEGGFRDNAYTNVMTSWLLHKTLQIYRNVPGNVRAHVSEKIGFSHEEFERWRDIKEKLAVVIDDDEIISQFDGWMDLLELDWDRYRRRYEDIGRLDRILKAEGDSPNKYKAVKQADTLQMFYLLSPGQVKHILELLGYEIDNEQTLMKRNYEYYVHRTTHGSTLSYVVHAGISKYLPSHNTDTWKWFLEALKSDVFDTQGGTTPEGIHCGVMAGVIEIITKNFAGINLFENGLAVNPVLPRGWDRLRFTLKHRSRLFHFDISGRLIRIRKEAVGLEGEKATYLKVGDRKYTFHDEPLEVEYTPSYVQL